MTAFTKATKTQAKLRLALEGPAGFGKTYTALTVARELVGPDGKIAFVDTEAGSAALYADLFDFDTIALEPPFHPDRFVDLIQEAEETHDIVVIDSLTHAWNGAGGVLSIVDEIKRTRTRGDGRAAWKDATPIQQRLVDAILRSRIHVIGCMRTKTDHFADEVEKDGAKRAVGRKVGMKTQQRDEFDYEFTLVGRFEQPAVLTITKSRCHLLPPAATSAEASDARSVIEKPGAEFAQTLLAWLNDGEAAPPKATPADRKKLDGLVKQLAEADDSRDWQEIVEKYAKREFGHGINALTKPEIAQSMAQLQTFLGTLSANGATAEQVPA